MQRNAFTMVELIFVIVIIGVLAATALPKFGGVRDNATANSEIAAMSSLDGAIAAAVEFRLQDYKDTNVSWHGDVTVTGTTLGNRQVTDYKNKVNAQNKVLKTILDKGDNFKITAAHSSDGNDVVASSTTTKAANDILYIIGPASAKNGVGISSTAPNSDIAGKPDKNDVWCFNPNTFDINVTNFSTTYSAEGNYVIVPAQSIKLIDVNGSSSRAEPKAAKVGTTPTIWASSVDTTL